MYYMKTYENLPLIRAKVNIDLLEENEIDFSFDLVEHAANYYEFLKFDNDIEKQCFSIDDEKMIITGVVMAANLPQYRSPKDKLSKGYYAFFSEEDVKNALLYFSKRKNLVDSVELNHESGIKIPGIVFENWIVSDSDKDKMCSFGLKVNKGSWCSSIQITDRKFWNDFIKTGKVKGFSVISGFELTEKFEKQINEFSFSKNENIKIEEKKMSKTKSLKFEINAITTDGTEVVIDELIEGSKIFVIEKGEKKPAPIGEYFFENNDKIIVTEEGVIAQIVYNSDEEMSKETETEENEFSFTKIEYDEFLNIVTSLTEKLNSINEKVNTISNSVIEFSKVKQNFTNETEIKTQIAELKLNIEKIKTDKKVEVVKIENKTKKWS